ncbi:hypothetical protein CLOHYLEM_03934 [[Clostridium] hylemonae DSM 15053]|uniref:Uncharacterized protein n=1 Tax=[Clostridium] hylemonae DSM 15053 TaxID=553973 RepID=C0BVS1_9FIRM|nr:hypothetical protein CLOHYLEM_03934 [[Clostridium] hylemonae DSM 15053]
MVSYFLTILHDSAHLSSMIFILHSYSVYIITFLYTIFVYYTFFNFISIFSCIIIKYGV